MVQRQYLLPIFYCPIEQPIEKKPEPIPEPKLEVVAKPKPKPKLTPKPKPVIEEPVVVLPKEKIIKPLDTIQQYIPKNIEFDRAKSEILHVSYPELDKLAAFLVRNPSLKVQIEGHTDYVGDAAKNLILSEKRERMRQLLIQLKKGSMPNN